MTLEIQKSNEETGGKLYLVATPIGNLQDFHPRAKLTLEQADLILAEDTRHTRKLLSYFKISKPLTSCHEHNETKQSEKIINRILKGETVALVSDAGMPAISDPGQYIVKKALHHKIPVIPIAGENAALAALIGSGLPTQPFTFIGFLSRNSANRKKELEKWSSLDTTLIFYESPHRLKAMLQDTQKILGDRRVAIARELTKKHEEWLRGTLMQCLDYLDQHGVRGEYTIVIEGGQEKQQTAWWEKFTIQAHVDYYITEGLDKKEAFQKVAKERKIPKREVYNVYHHSIFP